MPKTIKEYANQLGPRCDVGQLLKLRDLVKEDAYGGAEMLPDAPPPETADGEAGMDATFEAAMLSVLRQAMQDSDDPTKVKAAVTKIKKLLVTHGDLKDDDATEPEEPDPTKEGGGKPSKGKPVREGAPDLATVLSECDAEQFTPSTLVREALQGIPDAARRKSFIREQKGITAAKAPKSGGRDQVQENAPTGAAAPPTVVEKFRQYARENQGVPAAK